MRRLFASWWALPIFMGFCAVLGAGGGLVVRHFREPAVNPIDTAAEVCKGYVRGQTVTAVPMDFSGVAYAGKLPQVTITGTVRLPNSFGAPVVFNWTCVTRLNAGTWDVRYFQARLMTGIA